jgi:hypothetical protein
MLLLATPMAGKKVILLTLLILALQLINAQDNYEIQVYGAETTQAPSTTFELHSNISVFGNNASENGVRPTTHAWRNTLEITQGLAPNLELGFYLFTNLTPGYGYQWVGDHLRLRAIAPEKWKIPFGLGLSVEGGYQRKEYADETWSLEIRPIIDKKFDRFYIAFNPVIGVSLQSAYNSHRPVFEPAVELSAPINAMVHAGLEYYGSVGGTDKLGATPPQQHQIFIVSDWDFGTEWEFNIGAGVGLTNTVDALIFKAIIGYTADWRSVAGKKKASKSNP